MQTRRRFLGGAVAGLAAAAAPPLAATVAAATAPERTTGLTFLNSNENPFGPAPEAAGILGRARAAAARYPDLAEGMLVHDLAERHAVTSDEVVLGCGSSQILHAAAMAFGRAGRKVVAAEPTFEAVLAHAGVAQAQPVKVPLTGDFRHDLPRMAAACDAATALVYVCNPNNPTGTIVSRDELAGFVRALPPTTVALVDEAYFELVEDPGYASALELRARHPNVVVARTFSKIHGMAGLRLGYAIASRENAAALRDQLSWNNVNGPALEAARASLQDQKYLARVRSRLNGTRRWLCGELAKDGRRFIPSHANFLMIDVGGDVGPVIEAFRERRMLVGRRFPSLPNWLRVTIGTEEEMRAFLAGLRRIVPAAAAA
jgi:histidinol-phosphate aminotransferase